MKKTACFAAVLFLMAPCFALAADVKENAPEAETGRLPLPEKPLDDAGDDTDRVGLDGVEEIELGIATEVDDAGGMGLEFIGHSVELDFGGLFASMKEYNDYLIMLNRELDDDDYDGAFDAVNRVFVFGLRYRINLDGILGMLSPYVSAEAMLLAYEEERNNSDGRKIILNHNITAFYAGTGVRKYFLDRKDAEYINPYIGIDAGPVINFSRLSAEEYDSAGNKTDFSYPGCGYYTGTFAVNFEAGGDVLTDLMDMVIRAGYKLMLGESSGSLIAGTGLSGPYVKMGVIFGREK